MDYIKKALAVTCLSAAIPVTAQAVVWDDFSTPATLTLSGATNDSYTGIFGGISDVTRDITLELLPGSGSGDASLSIGGGWLSLNNDPDVTSKVDIIYSNLRGIDLTYGGFADKFSFDLVDVDQSEDFTVKLTLVDDRGVSYESDFSQGPVKSPETVFLDYSSFASFSGQPINSVTVSIETLTAGAAIGFDAINAVPAPAPLASLALGLVGLGLFRRQKKVA